MLQLFLELNSISLAGNDPLPSGLERSGWRKLPLFGNFRWTCAQRLHSARSSCAGDDVISWHAICMACKQLPTGGASLHGLLTMPPWQEAADGRCPPGPGMRQVSQSDGFCRRLRSPHSRRARPCRQAVRAIPHSSLAPVQFRQLDPLLPGLLQRCSGADLEQMVRQKLEGLTGESWAGEDLGNLFALLEPLAVADQSPGQMSDEALWGAGGARPEELAQWQP